MLYFSFCKGKNIIKTKQKISKNILFFMLKNRIFVDY